MPDRTQILVLSGVLAVGLIVGSLATVIILPAVRTQETAAQPAKKSTPVVVRTAALAKTKPAPNTATPLPTVVPPTVHAETKEARKTYTPSPYVVPSTFLSEAKTAAQPAPLAPETVLRGKGLKQEGQVFLLPEEDGIEQQSMELSSVAADYRSIVARMNDLESFVEPLERRWFELQQGQQALALQAAGPAVTFQGESHPAPKSNTPATGATGEGQKPGDADKAKEERDRKDAELAQEKLEAQRRAAAQDAARSQAIMQTQERLLGIQSEMRQLENKVDKAQREYSTKMTLGMQKQDEIERRWVALGQAQKRLQSRYNELNNDGEVKAALGELNKDGIRFGLGPRPKLQATLAKMEVDMLKDKGVVGGKKGFTTVASRKVKEVKEKTQYYAVQLRTKQKPSPGETKMYRQKLAIWSQSVDELNAQHAKAATATQKIALNKALSEAKAQVAKYKKNEDFRKSYRSMRDAFVQSLVDLRKALDESQRKDVELAQNGGPAVGQKKPPIAQTSLHDLDYLKNAEAAIVTEEIGLQPDKAGLWVDVMVNDNRQKIRMIVDPSVDIVRISTKAAAELGIKTTSADQTVKIALDKGQFLEAKQTFLKSLLVGGGEFKASEVECLIVTDNEAPAVLGASFLEQFSFTLDSATGKLTLKKVALAQLNKLSSIR